MKVKSEVPTVYQLSSISSLCGGWQKQPNGSYKFEDEFDSKTECEAFLYSRLANLYNSGKIDEDELRGKREEIGKGYLSYDSAVLTIENDEDYV